MFSLRYWKDIENLLFWVLWAQLATNTRNDNQFIENVHVNLRKENQLHFSRNIPKIWKLLISGTSDQPPRKELYQFLNILIIYHHTKSQKKLMKRYARKFYKNYTTQENIRIFRLKKRFRNLYNKETFKPGLSNALEKPLASISLDFLKASD